MKPSILAIALIIGGCSKAPEPVAVQAPPKPAAVQVKPPTTAKVMPILPATKPQPVAQTILSFTEVDKLVQDAVETHRLFYGWAARPPVSNIYVAEGCLDVGIVATVNCEFDNHGLRRLRRWTCIWTRETGTGANDVPSIFRTKTGTSKDFAALLTQLEHEKKNN